MTRAGKSLAVMIGTAVVAATAAAQGMPAAMPAAPVRLSDVVDPAFREAVAKVVRSPVISTRGTTPEVVCTPAVWDWLLEHPDRVALAWQRLKVPCVDITDLGGGRFSWADGEGSEVTWQTVGRYADGVVWYATGKVKPNAVTPTVPVRCVVVLSHPRRPTAGGLAAVKPSVQAYLHTDSRAANVVLRVLGPTAPKMAEQAAEQLLYFFNGIAKHVQNHPDQTETLLGPKR